MIAVTFDFSCSAHGLGPYVDAHVELVGRPGGQ
jgi:hypothetical protein